MEEIEWLLVAYYAVSPVMSLYLDGGEAEAGRKTTMQAGYKKIG